MKLFRFSSKGFGKNFVSSENVFIAFALVLVLVLFGAIKDMGAKAAPERCYFNSNGSFLKVVTVISTVKSGIRFIASTDAADLGGLS